MFRALRSRAVMACALGLLLLAGPTAGADDPKPTAPPVKVPQAGPALEQPGAQPAAKPLDLAQAEKRLRARAQRYQGAANAIRVVGRPQVPADHARIGAYERAAKLLAHAAEMLQKLRAGEGPPSTLGGVLQALPADARKAFGAAIRLPANPSKLRVGGPDGLAERFGSARRSGKRPPATRAQVEEALEKLERAQRLAELRAERLELETRGARLEAERIEIQAEMLRNRVRQQAAERGQPDPFADEDDDEGDDDADADADDDALRLETPRVRQAEGAWVLQTVHVGGYEELDRVFGDLAKYAADKGLELAGQAFSIHVRMPDDDGEPETICGFVIDGPKTLLHPFATKAYELRKAPPVRVLSLRARGHYSKVGKAFQKLQEIAKRENLKAAGPLRALYFDDPDEVDPNRTRFEVQMPIE